MGLLAFVIATIIQFARRLFGRLTSTSYDARLSARGNHTTDE